MRNGVSHREDGPAYRRHMPNPYNHNLTERCREEWLRNGTLDREDGPAIIDIGPDDVVFLEAWFRGGVLHRLNGPAQIERDIETGRIVNEVWYLNGQIHRDDGPAIISTDAETGIVVREQFFQAGVPYREEGSYADISYDRISGTPMPQRISIQNSPLPALKSSTKPGPSA